MTTQPVSQFEEQFSRLSAGEQLFLLERLARHCQLGDATHNASHQPVHGKFAANPELLREPVRSAVCVAASLLLLMIPVSAAGQTNDVPAGWTVLNLKEAVVVINELTPLQLNLECTAWTPPERVAMPLRRGSGDRFTNVTVEAVQSLFVTVENYTWTGSNDDSNDQVTFVQPKSFYSAIDVHLELKAQIVEVDRPMLRRVCLCQ